MPEKLGDTVRGLSKEDIVHVFLFGLQHHMGAFITAPFSSAETGDCPIMSCSESDYGDSVGGTGTSSVVAPAALIRRRCTDAVSDALSSESSLFPRETFEVDTK